VKKGGRSGPSACKVAVDGYELETRGTDLALRGAARIVIRPERVGLEEHGAPSGPNRIPGMVERVVYVGSAVQVIVRAATGESLQALVRNTGQGIPWEQGTPVQLHLPPDALRVFLEAFEGPLDLLLYLIRKQNFNILDIPLASVTRQYLAYVEQIRKTNLELASDYLLMAAMLIEIKSRMLLPPKKTAEGEEAEDPRAELVRRLLEYEQMKLAAARLNAVPQLGRDVLRAQVFIEQSLQPRFPDVHVADLQEAWRDILRRAKLVQHHKITREQLSVREHMSMVLKKLQGRKFVEFEQLFDFTKGAPVLIVTFIAMLELAKETLIEVTQAEAYAPIYVRLAFQPA
jgi:segregation and condensation protein A